MELQTVDDLFALSAGDAVTKRNLFDLIQFSKVESSQYWAGADSVIGNTPQQGINWVGPLPGVRAVIIKTRPGSYEDDGWIDGKRTAYRYSFKARKGEVSYREKANAVLIAQVEHRYPILLFTEHASCWLFEGAFSVAEIESRFVVLKRGNAGLVDLPLPGGNDEFVEGERKFVTHLMAERSRAVVRVLKDCSEWVCDICELDFESKYGVKYIEAHHKIPISIYTASYRVAVSDFALLCPNCHKAVHIYMKKGDIEYAEIRDILRRVEI